MTTREVLGPFPASMFEGLLKGREDDDYSTRILPEAQEARLREYNDLYQSMVQNGTKFQPGDMVTPRAGYGTKGVGQPHVVLETRHAGVIDPHWTNDVSASSNGKRQDVRVACFVNDRSMVAFWVESFEYEPYTG